MSKVVKRRQQLAMTEVSCRAEDHQHGRVDGQMLQPLNQRVLAPSVAPEARCGDRTALHGSRSKAHGRRRTTGLEGRSIGVADRRPRRASNSSPILITRFAIAVAGVGSRRRLGCMSELRAGRSLATVTRLASSAALGGFLFGYDSSVINGAVSAIGNHYRVGSHRLGIHRFFGVARCRRGCNRGGPGSGSLRSADRDAVGCSAVLDQCAGDRARRLAGVADRVSRDWWGRCRDGVGGRAGLYRGDRPGARPGSTGLSATAGDRVGDLRGAAGRLCVCDRGRRFRQAILAGPRGVAVDVLGDDRAGADLRWVVADNPRVAALPGLAGASPGSEAGAAPRAG